MPQKEGALHPANAGNAAANRSSLWERQNHFSTFKGETLDSKETVSVTLFNRLFPNLLTRGQQTSAKAQLRKSFRLCGSSRVLAGTSHICHWDTKEVRDTMYTCECGCAPVKLFTDPEM